MRKIFLPILLLAVAVITLNSCLRDDDDNDVTYYGDTAISAFTLGTLNRTMHTLSSQENDSTYQTTVTGSNYKFYIDQLSHEIYNVDSLPLGTDVEHVVCTISSKNNGIITIKNIDSDTLKYYSSSDSIDFSVPREVVVYSNDGNTYRTYTVRVNVHQEDGDVFNWAQLQSNSTLAQLENMRACSQDGRVYVYGQQDGNTVCYSTAETDGNTWTETALPDIANASDELPSADSDDAEYLPTQDISIVRIPKATNAGAYQTIMVGNRSLADYPDDATAMVWGRVEETAAGAVSQPWQYYEFSDDNTYKAPRLENLQVVAYGQMAVALGGKGIGGCTEAAFSGLYASADGGITWNPDALTSLPDGFSSSSTSFAMTASEHNYLWIICGGTGQVWRGRLNRLGWAEVQRAFTE